MFMNIKRIFICLFIPLSKASIDVTMTNKSTGFEQRAVDVET